MFKILLLALVIKQTVSGYGSVLTGGKQWRSALKTQMGLCQHCDAGDCWQYHTVVAIQDGEAKADARTRIGKAAAVFRIEFNDYVVGVGLTHGIIAYIPYCTTQIAPMIDLISGGGDSGEGAGASEKERRSGGVGLEDWAAGLAGWYPRHLG